VWQFNARDQEDARAPDVAVKLPKVKKDDIDEVELTTGDKPKITLKKTDSGWILTEPLKAEADKNAVDALLSKLDEMEVLGVAATKPENYDKLEVTAAKGTHVVAKKDGKPLTDLIIGTYRSGNTMVRETNAVNVATVKGSIKYAFDKGVSDWRDKTITQYQGDQIKSITFANAKGTFHFVKDDKTWKQAPGDKVLPKFDSGKLISLAGTAATLHAQDFAKPEITPDAAGVGAKPDGTVEYTLGGDAGEQTVKLRVGHKIDNGYYMMREGKDPIFIATDFGGSRMLSGPDAFQKDEASKGPVGSKNNPAVADVIPNPHAAHH
jgi:hypothetical protein